ncbi:MAG: DUF86 domain-containing protein [Nanoarchaeota archaeon]
MKKELRANLISAKIRDLKNSLVYIKEFLPSDFIELKDRGARNKLYKEVEFAIQLCLDICSIIISDIGKETPNEEEDIFVLAEKERVVSHTLSKKLQEMRGFRNLLVHRYGEINNEIAYENIVSGLNDFELFIKETTNFLEKQKKVRK